MTITETPSSPRTAPTAKAEKLLDKLVTVDARLKKSQEQTDSLVKSRVETLQACVDAGLTYRYIAARLGISQQGVYGILNRRKKQDGKANA